MKYSYPHNHAPISGRGGLPILCGATYCSRPAMIWLNDKEEREYLRGVTAFLVIRHGTMQVT
jgi:hypothetical protein